MEINDEQLRGLVLDALSFSQIGEWLFNKVAALGKERGFVPPPPPTGHGFGGTRLLNPDTGDHLTNNEEARVRSIIWDLFIEGIIRPGSNDGLNNDWPFFHITKSGKEFLEGRSPSPFDPDGYLTKVKAISGIDPVIVTYLEESLRTFRIRCYLASTVTLGCAVEKALLLLIESCTNALPAADQPAFRKKTEGRQIKNQFEEFDKMLIGRIKAKLPKDIDDLLHVQFAGIFDIIRNQRNAAGHPTGTAVSQQDAHSNLYVFPVFLERVYTLIDWLKSNPI